MRLKPRGHVSCIFITWSRDYNQLQSQSNFTEKLLILGFETNSGYDQTTICHELALNLHIPFKIKAKPVDSKTYDRLNNDGNVKRGDFNLSGNW